MRLQLDQFARYNDFISFRLSLITETDKEKSKLPKCCECEDCKDIEADRLIKDIQISPELLGTKEHTDAIGKSIIELYKEWEFVKCQKTEED